MVKVSHARCRRCGKARHRNARFNLCRLCWQQEKEHVRAKWRDIKDRRAEKREAVEEAVPLVVAQVIEEVSELPRQSLLTPEQEQEVIKLYTDTDTPVKEIAETYGLGDTTPFRILAKHGVTWRRGDQQEGGRTGPKRELPAHIAAMSEVKIRRIPADEAPVEPTPEEEPVPSQAFTSDGPVEPTPADFADLTINGVATTLLDKVEGPWWEVEVHTFIRVNARNAGAAIAEVEKRGIDGDHVENVRRLA